MPRLKVKVLGKPVRKDMENRPTRTRGSCQPSLVLVI